MNVVSTSFFLKWSDTKAELARIATEAADSARFNTFALCHGLFEYKIHRYRNRIMSVEHRSNALSEDFIGESFIASYRFLNEKKKRK